MIERHAIAHPHSVAAEHHGATLTHGELDHYAAVLATRLVREGVRPGTTGSRCHRFPDSPSACRKRRPARHRVCHCSSVGCACSRW
ncbi:hypothetical protein ABZX77_09095 [Streptomyces sp. NPDC004237]|uniref:hypothetical protein n=1 Tax=Streptomyces sp. NPDC004237 TaxID=3154455 RepID=UPI00339F47F2